MSDEKVSRRDLDQLSSHILINLGLINVAALAGVLSSNKTDLVSWPYILGLAAAILAQLFWYCQTAFEYLFGDAQDSCNKKLEGLLAFATLICAGLAGFGIFYGCISLLKISALWLSIFSWTLCCLPIALIVIMAILEVRARSS